MPLHKFAACGTAFVALFAMSAAFAADAPPQTSPDGLQLQQQGDKHRLVYVRPGASLAQYDKVAIVDCYVEFEKNWEKDYNNSRVGLEERVSDKDIDRMKTALAAGFKDVFARELQEDGGYQVVDAVAPDVLVLRPALINVEVNAPDLMTADFRTTVVRSAGQMTLYLELWDAATNTIIARVVDAETDEDNLAKPANRATNTQAADRILKEWAVELRKRLDAARGKAAS